MTLFARPSSVFAPPSALYIAFFHPLYTFLAILHGLLVVLRGPPYRPPRNRTPIRITCISDTHSKIPSTSLPPGDLLIHAGDLTSSGSRTDIQRAIDWLKTLQKPWPGSRDGYRYIIVVAGNHDSYLDPRSRSVHDRRFQETRTLDWGKIIYLQHGSAVMPFPGLMYLGEPERKLKVYGAPQIPRCGGKEFAFQYPRGVDAWGSTVPDDVDILVTHNPPKWHLDVAENGGLGCEHELAECWRVRPTLHVFGHVHSGHGKEGVWWDDGQQTFESICQHVFGAIKLPSPPPPGSETIFRAIGECFDLKLWRLGLRMLLSDFRGLVWNRLWGGARSGSWMINAALTYQTTDMLGNPPQTVVL